MSAPETKVRKYLISRQIPGCLLLIFFLFIPKSVSAQEETPITIVVAGDIACASGQVSEKECRQQATAELVQEINPTAVLTVGDHQYERGEYDNFLKFYDPAWGRFKEITHPSVGDHEYLTAKAEGYYSYFGDRAGDPDKGYYSFDIADWNFIALNSNCEEVGGCYFGSDQEVWLRNNLAKNSKTCTAAYWHHPRFSSGVVHGSRVKYQPFWRALFEYKADLVFAGHDHAYERFIPQDANGKADANGIAEFVVGTGGNSLYKFGVPLATSQARYNEDFGVLKLTLHEDSYNWEFINLDRQVVDSGEGSCVKGKLGRDTREATQVKTITQLLPVFLVLMFPLVFIVFLEFLERKGWRKPTRG